MTKHSPAWHDPIQTIAPPPAEASSHILSDPDRNPDDLHAARPFVWLGVAVAVVGAILVGVFG